METPNSNNKNDTSTQRDQRIATLLQRIASDTEELQFLFQQKQQEKEQEQEPPVAPWFVHQQQQQACYTPKRHEQRCWQKKQNKKYSQEKQAQKLKIALDVAKAKAWAEQNYGL